MKAIIFLHYRAGSSFFQHLAGLTPKFLRLPSELITRPLLTTRPRIPVKYIDSGNLTTVAKENNNFSNICILTHIGNWWGDLPPYLIPSPLSSPSPTKWSDVELRPFLYQGWKFVNLMRDGRNLIESTRQYKGGVEEEQVKIKGAQYFEELCLAFRNKARVALHTQQALGKDNYKIFKFEDLMDQPLQFMNDIYRFCFKLPADDDMVRERLKQIRETKNNHSSFKGSNMNKRYLSWTEEETQLFKRIARQEQRELGYDC